MPKCGNCGSFVTDRYVRVFKHPDDESVQVCPHCPDMVRSRGQARKKKGQGLNK